MIAEGSEDEVEMAVEWESEADLFASSPSHTTPSLFCSLVTFVVVSLVNGGSDGEEEVIGRVSALSRMDLSFDDRKKLLIKDNIN